MSSTTVVPNKGKSVSHRSKRSELYVAPHRRSGTETRVTHYLSPPQPPTGNALTPGNYARYLKLYERFLDLMPFTPSEEPPNEVNSTVTLPKLGKSTPVKGVVIKSKTCISCKTEFPSGSKLHQHLNTNPTHRRPPVKRVVYVNDRPSDDLKDQIISLPDNEELRAHLTGEFDGDIFAALKTFGMQEIRPFGELPGPILKGNSDNAVLIPPPEEPSANIRDLVGRFQGEYAANKKYAEYMANKPIQELSDDEDFSDPVAEIMQTFPRSVNVEGERFSITYSSFIRLSHETKMKVLGSQMLTSVEFAGAHIIPDVAEIQEQKKGKKKVLNIEDPDLSQKDFTKINPDSNYLVKPPTNSAAGLITSGFQFPSIDYSSPLDLMSVPDIDPDERIAGPSTNTRDEFDFDSD